MVNPKGQVLTSSHAEIASRVNQCYSEQKPSPDGSSLSNVIDSILMLLSELNKDKIGRELLTIVEKKLFDKIDATEYVKALLSVLIDENNIIKPQAKIKYALVIKAIYDLDSRIKQAILSLILVIFVFLSLALCFMVIPAPVYLFAVLTTLIAFGSLSMLCNEISSYQVKKIDQQSFELARLHNDLLNKFDSVTVQQKISDLTGEEQQALNQKKIKLYVHKKYTHTDELEHGYHYYHNCPDYPELGMFFYLSDKVTIISMGSIEGVNVALQRLRGNDAPPSSEYDCSKEEISQLMADGKALKPHDAWSAESPLCHATLRMRKLRFIFTEYDRSPPQATQETLRGNGLGT
jgi:hypothetical protein